MDIIEISPQALQSFQMLIRLIKGLDDKLPGVALVKNQAEAVKEVMEGHVSIETEKTKRIDSRFRLLLWPVG